MAGKYGLRATTSFGLGILRSNATAKMTNIKNDFIVCVSEVCFLWVVVYMVCFYILFIRVAGLVKVF